MPTETVIAIKNKFLRHYPDAEAHVDELFNETHLDLLERLPIVIQQVDLHLTADQGAYAVANGTPWFDINTANGQDTRELVQVFSAEYYDSHDSGSGFTLTPTSISELDIDHPRWRINAASTPRVFAVHTSEDGNATRAVTLYPAPSRSTSGSGTAKQNFVRLRYSVYSAITDRPSSMLDSNPYVYGMAMLWTAQEDRDMHGFYLQKYQLEVTRLARRLGAQARNARRGVRQTFFRSTPTY